MNEPYDRVTKAKRAALAAAKHSRKRYPSTWKRCVRCRGYNAKLWIECVGVSWTCAECGHVELSTLNPQPSTPTPT